MLSITADIKVPILIKPRGVRLMGFEGDEIFGTVTIRAEEDNPLILNVSKITIPDKVAYELKSVEKGKTFQLVLRNKLQKRSKYFGYVTLKTNYADKPVIKVPFLGFVRGNVEVRPKRINFIITDSSKVRKNDLHFARSILVTAHKGDNLKIKSVEVNPEMFETRVEEIQVGKKYRVVVKVKPAKTTPSEITETIKIYTNQRENTVIDIPVRVRHDISHSRAQHVRPKIKDRRIPRKQVTLQ